MKYYFNNYKLLDSVKITHLVKLPPGVMLTFLLGSKQSLKITDYSIRSRKVQNACFDTKINSCIMLL